MSIQLNAGSRMNAKNTLLTRAGFLRRQADEIERVANSLPDDLAEADPEKDELIWQLAHIMRF